VFSDDSWVPLCRGSVLMGIEHRNHCGHVVSSQWWSVFTSVTESLFYGFSLNVFSVCIFLSLSEYFIKALFLPQGLPARFYHSCSPILCSRYKLVAIDSASFYFKINTLSLSV